jgi:uncharacterized protein (UPF0212 family)
VCATLFGKEQVMVKAMLKILCFSVPTIGASVVPICGYKADVVFCVYFISLIGTIISAMIAASLFD